MSENVLKAGYALRDGRYTIKRLLGKGSFGITYLATAKVQVAGALGEMEAEIQVAIKEFFMGEVNSRSNDGSSVEGSGSSAFGYYRAKFRREAENLSSISHPNIVKVMDVFDENGTTYYVMQYIAGENLDEYITRCGNLSEQEALQILTQVGAALTAMHHRNMLHLDLKPRNIMRRKDGCCFLIDFGLSKQFTDDGEPESSTSIGLGTAGYAPIEQAQYKAEGALPVTLDVYALGATLYKMLSGRRPAVASDILNNGFDRKELLSAGVSSRVVDLVQKAMMPQRAARFATVADMVAAAVGDSEGTLFEEPEKPEPEKPEPEKPKEKIKLVKEQPKDIEVEITDEPNSYLDCMRTTARNLFNIKGRASRYEFWTSGLTLLPLCLVMVVSIGNPPYVLADFLSYYVQSDLYEVTSLVWSFPMIIGILLLTFALEARRLNDCGHSRWWAAVFNIPLPLFSCTFYVSSGEEFFIYNFFISLFISFFIVCRSFLAPPKKTDKKS